MHRAIIVLGIGLLKGVEHVGPSARQVGHGCLSTEGVGGAALRPHELLVPVAAAVVHSCRCGPRILETMRKAARIPQITLLKRVRRRVLLRVSCRHVGHAAVLRLRPHEIRLGCLPVHECSAHFAATILHVTLRVDTP